MTSVVRDACRYADRNDERIRSTFLLLRLLEKLGIQSSLDGLMTLYVYRLSGK
jgi:hypothetical protein